MRLGETSLDRYQFWFDFFFLVCTHIFSVPVKKFHKKSTFSAHSSTGLWLSTASLNFSDVHKDVEFMSIRSQIIIDPAWNCSTGYLKL